MSGKSPYENAINDPEINTLSNDLEEISILRKPVNRLKFVKGISHDPNTILKVHNNASGKLNTEFDEKVYKNLPDIVNEPISEKNEPNKHVHIPFTFYDKQISIGELGYPSLQGIVDPEFQHALDYMGDDLKEAQKCFENVDVEREGRLESDCEKNKFYKYCNHFNKIGL